MKHSLSKREMKYLPVRRDYSQEKNLNRLAVLIFAAILTLLLGLTVERFVIDPMLTPETVHAAEVIHQNDYYCEAIIRGEMKVNPNEVTANQLLALCAQYL